MNRANKPAASVLLHNVLRDGLGHGEDMVRGHGEDWKRHVQPDPTSRHRLVGDEWSEWKLLFDS